MAPHADDEIIGCYELLASGLVHTVVYGTEEAMNEAVECAEHFDFKATCAEDYDFDIIFDKHILVFPDPYFEQHPEHRKWGAIGEALLREGREVQFYTTNMNAPYIHEVELSGKKKSSLNEFYSKKSSLWKFDHRYWLFEGRVQWIITNQKRNE